MIGLHTDHGRAERNALEKVTVVCKCLIKLKHAVMPVLVIKSRKTAQFDRFACYVHTFKRTYLLFIMCGLGGFCIGGQEIS